MAATPVFALVAADLQKKIQPIAAEQAFKVGTDGDLSSADAEVILATWEEHVLSRIPHRYRQLCREVDGEILVRYAAGGEASATVSLKPIATGTLRVWLNFPSARLWNNRDASLALVAGTDYSVNETTGVITLTTALSAGDSLWASYRHTAGSSFLMLRDLAVTLAAVEVSRVFPFFRDAEGGERFTNWETSANEALASLRSIDVFDRIELVRGETEPQHFYRRIELLGTEL